MVWIIITGGDADYQSGPYTVTFVAGQTHALFNISLTDDDSLEDRETFMLTINSSSLPSNIIRGNLNQTMITIVDNDSK